MSQKNVIQKFTRDVLGCMCPDDVFKDIHCQWRSISPAAYQVFEIRIGGRLLIFLWDITRAAVPGDFLTLIRTGRAIRDKDGFNRFRMVVAGNLQQNIKSDIENQFQSGFQDDEKVHLHFINSQQIPQSLFSNHT